VPALDGVRGLAILMVLGAHLINFNHKPGASNILWTIHELGATGVDLFFVLSGFLITGILYDTLQDRNYFSSFYMRRFLRIFPLYYGFLFLMLALTHIIHIAWGGRQYALLTYTQNTGIWFPVTTFHLGPFAELGHLWSLAVEEQFYLAWPLVIFLVRKRSLLIGTTLALTGTAVFLRIVLYLRGTSVDAIATLTLCQMDTLLLGACLALIIRGNGAWIPRRCMTPFALVAAALVLIYKLSHADTDPRTYFYGGTFNYLVIALGFLALLAAAIDPASVANRIFSWPVLKRFGKYSYGIYVLHILVSNLFMMLTEKVFGISLRNLLTPWLHSRILAVLVEFCVNTAVVFLAAYTSYNLYEVHFLRLKRYFGYGSRQKKIPAPVAQ
jgi:peptidoglycan/LPS O-acetylase OafA/YrhL